jgi:hypothetical protein
MPKRNLPATRAATLPANWEEQMAADTKADAAAVAGIGGGAWLSIRNGVLKFQGTPLPESQLDCVVLASIFDKAYYGGVPFDADNPASPVCWALGEDVAGQDIKKLVPSDDSHDRQHDACEGCAMNEFGSSDRGKGKACKDQVRLALLHVDYLKADLIADAPVVFIRVPPTSISAWGAHVKKITSVLEKPKYTVVTRVSVAPDDKVQVRVSFDVQDDIRDKKLLGAIYLKRQAALKEIGLPYQWLEPSERKPARKPAKPAKPAKKALAAPPPPAKPAKGAKPAATGFGKF